MRNAGKSVSIMHISVSVLGPQGQNLRHAYGLFSKQSSGAEVKIQGRRENWYKDVTELVTSADCDWCFIFRPWSIMKCKLELGPKGKNGEAFIHQHLFPH